MFENVMDGQIYVVGDYQRDTSIDYLEWHGVLVAHETYCYSATIESVWVEVAGSDVEITKLLNKKQLKTLKDQWEEELQTEDPLK